jgi:hypothetical protein
LAEITQSQQEVHHPSVRLCPQQVALQGVARLALALVATSTTQVGLAQVLVVAEEWQGCLATADEQALEVTLAKTEILVVGAEQPLII